MIEIGGVHAHSGAGFSFGAERYAGFYGNIPERAIALIAIELVWLGVIGYQKIGPAVAIVIERWRRPEILSWCQRCRTRR